MKKMKLICPILLTSTFCSVLTITSCSKPWSQITIVNNSDRFNISFDSMPETWKENQDLSLSFVLSSQSITIDADASTITSNSVELKNKEGVIITDTNLFIPGKYIRKDLTISLQVKNCTFKLINQSSGYVSYDSLPSEVISGYSINIGYKIVNDQIVDIANSYILVGNEDIKSKSGVFFDNYCIQIPGEYVQDNVTIGLLLRDRNTYSVDTSSCSGVTITGLSSTIKEQTKISATYTIDSATAIIDRQLSDILVDGVSIANKSGVKYLDKEINIPKEYVTGNVTIKIVTEGAKLIDQSWSTVIDACNKYEADGDLTSFLASFTIDGATVSSLDELIGAKKAITLQFYNESTKQYINKTQLVRIVDYNHDTISGGNTKAALTFQLVNLLSDVNGNQMRCVYDNDEKNKYSSSKLHDNLVNTEYNKAKWYDKNNKQITDYDDSVYYMLSKGQPELLADGAIKTIDKYVNESSGEYPSYVWTETKIESKIFPSLFTEMNLVKEESDPSVETQNVSVYKYWSTHSSASDRIMKDENNSAYYYWLASPWTNNTAFAWTITESGQKNYCSTKSNLFGVQFGFAI